MYSPFQLISASLLRPNTEGDGTTDSLRFVRHAEVSTWNAPFSVIIGRNGSGKSRLLSAIAGTFLELEDLRSSGRRPSSRTLPLCSLEYRLSGDLVRIESGERLLEVTLNGRPISIQALPLPSRVVALTMSAFDKFPVLSPRQLASSEVYRYLGLKDRTGRASSTRLLSELILNLFQEVEGSEERSRRARISETFDYLGFDPSISVTYRLRVSGNTIEALAADSDVELLESYAAREVLRIKSYLKQSGYPLPNFLKDIHLALDWSVGRRVEAEANFRNFHESYDRFNVLNRLRQAGIFTIDGVQVRHPGESAFDLKDASSGEQTMLAMFVGLASTLTENSLVLIDEPETSLHPQWQSEFVKRLLQSFQHFSGIDYLVATHSPLIISDIPEGTHVYSFDQSTKITIDKTVAGASSDLILAELFNAPGRRNLHVRDKIARAFRMLATNRQHTEEYASALSSLALVLEDTPDGDPSIPVIRELLKI